MAKLDVVLLHPPSVYDFRKTPFSYGPISDVIPSTPIFEMYPIGFVSLLGYLENRGYHVRIVNIAVKMLRDQAFDVEREIRKLDPLLFGIDLHWLVHAQGSMELARIVKKEHPNTPVIVGGLSATYYCKEVLSSYPNVDFVIRGDSTEEPLVRLLETVGSNRDLSNVPNLAWRHNDHVCMNPLSYVPKSLDDLKIDYERMVKHVARHFDIEGALPYESWLEYPFSALITCKGCMHNCVTCGGSNATFKRICGREKPAFKSPERLVEEMLVIEQYVKGPVFLLGDFRQAGGKYAIKLLDGIKKERIKNPIVFELFSPISDDLLAVMSNACTQFNIEISPETHDEQVRRLQGRPYCNRDLENTLKRAVERNCGKIDVFFMIGLPGQTAESAMATVGYCEQLLTDQGKNGRVYPFISPLAPFLDPGSLAFENPDRYGYHLFSTSLKDHVSALSMLSWKHCLNYNTVWMSRDDILDATYKCALALNNVKSRFGLLESEDAVQINQRILSHHKAIRNIDDAALHGLISGQDTYAISRDLKQLRESLTCSKKELRSPVKAKIRKLTALEHIIIGFRKSSSKRRE